MDNIFDKKVVEKTEKSMVAIQSELDHDYCKKNEVVFSNSEVDMLTTPLYTKASVEIAFDMLYTESNK